MKRLYLLLLLAVLLLLLNGGVGMHATIAGWTWDCFKATV